MNYWVAFWALLGAFGGIAAAVQSPLVSLISQRLGLLESIFIIHLGGALASLLLLLAQGGGQLASFRVLPWYALAGGMLGLVILSAIALCIPKLGVAATITAFVVGQLAFGVLIDHMGWFGAVTRAVEPTRLLGLALVVLGTYLILR